MIVGIHQPNYLPWIGYFHKIARCDRFVFLDDAQYTRGGFLNRNRIKTSQGVEWLTVPVRATGRFGARIHETIPCWDVPWPKKHLRALEVNYGPAACFDEVMHQVVAPLLLEASRARLSLSRLNIALVRKICEYLRIETPLTEASDFGVQAESTGRLIELVRHVGGTAYLSGGSGDKYQDHDKFASAGISVAYNDFEHPEYKQLWGRFEPNLSVIDLLFSRGRSAAELFQTSRTVSRDEIKASFAVAQEV